MSRVHLLRMQLATALTPQSLIQQVDFVVVDLVPLFVRLAPSGKLSITFSVLRTH